jgi:dihydroflavonol-4-reductase
LKNRIVITGANGLVGSAVARKMLTAGYEVVVLIRKNADTTLLKPILKELRVLEGDILDIFSLEDAIQADDVVIHTAAIVSFSSKEQANMMKTNVEGTANVVNICLAKKAHKLLYISSVAAIGRPSNLHKTKGIIGIDEEQKWEDSPNNSFYAKTKYMAECEVWRGVAEGLDATIVCPSVVLGEGDWHKSSTQLFKYVSNENRFYTGGIVNYVDVEDVATIIQKLHEDGIVNERFIVSAGHLSYLELFTKIAKQLNKRPPSILVKPQMAEILWRLEAIRSFFTGKTPLITRETAQTAKHLYQYDSKKLLKTIDFQYKTLDQSLSRIGGYFFGL